MGRRKFWRKLEGATTAGFRFLQPALVPKDIRKIAMG